MKCITAAIMTIDLYNQYFDISSESPSGLIWKKNTSTSTQTSRKAGWLDTSNGYWKVQLLDKNYYVHRVVYEMTTGDALAGDYIDHIDGDRENNSPANLRKVTASLNARNISPRSDNLSGVTGLRYDSMQDRWVVYWKINGKRKSKTFRCKPTKEISFIEAYEFNKKVRLMLRHDHGYTGRNDDF